MNAILDLPVFWAFSAGMLASVNPCGFALLPSYIAYFLGTEERAFAQQSREVRLARAALLGLLVTTGFIAVFSVVGILVSLGGRTLIAFVPWASGTIGVILMLLGVAIFTGRALHLPIALPRFNPRGRGITAAFFFGIAYAIASLSCTLPIFLLVVGGTLALQGVGLGLTLFVSYGLGMGAVLVALTMSAALFKGVLTRYLRAALPYVERVSAVFLLGAGAYLVLYQLYWYGGFWK